MDQETIDLVQDLYEYLDCLSEGGDDDIIDTINHAEDWLEKHKEAEEHPDTARLRWIAEHAVVSVLRFPSSPTPCAIYKDIEDCRAQIDAAMKEDKEQSEDICGLCGKPGADKYAHPEHWPGERIPDGPLVHAECEQEECRRAHAELTDKQREDYIRRIK